MHVVRCHGPPVSKLFAALIGRESIGQAGTDGAIVSTSNTPRMQLGALFVWNGLVELNQALLRGSAWWYIKP